MEQIILELKTMKLTILTLIKPPNNHGRIRCNRWKGRYPYMVIGQNRTRSITKGYGDSVSLVQVRQNTYQKIPPMFFEYKKADFHIRMWTGCTTKQINGFLVQEGGGKDGSNKVRRDSRILCRPTMRML
jgi:hypothetical protein